MAIFGPKRLVNRFGKMLIFLNFEPLFYSLERVFFVLEYRERHFPCVYCLKKQIGIMVIFGQKLLGNPFVKMSIFRLC